MSKRELDLTNYESTDLDFGEATPEFRESLADLTAFLGQQGWLRLVQGWSGSTGLEDLDGGGRPWTSYWLYLNKESNGIWCGRQFDASAGYRPSEKRSWKYVSVMQRFMEKGKQTSYVKFDIDGMGTHYEKYRIIFSGTDGSSLHLELSRRHPGYRKVWGKASDGEELQTYLDNGTWKTDCREELEGRGFNLRKLESIEIPEMLAFARLVLESGIERNFHSLADANASFLNILAPGV